jgi:hypothetical protein
MRGAESGRELEGAGRRLLLRTVEGAFRGGWIKGVGERRTYYGRRGGHSMSFNNVSSLWQRLQTRNKSKN